METTSPQRPLPPFASYASWAHLAAIITAILAIIGSLTGGGGTLSGTVVAIVLNPIAWLAIWFWVKSKRFTCPHCGVGIPITSELTMQEVGTILRCPKCRNLSRKPVVGGHGDSGNEFTVPQFQSVDWYREQWKKYTDVIYSSALLRLAVNSYLEVLKKCVVFVLSPLFIFSPITFNTLLNCYLAVLNNSGQFGGRARRKEFWMFVLVHSIINIIFLLIYVALFVVLTSFEKLLGITSPFIGSFLAVSFSIFWVFSLTISAVAVGVRRLHDTDHSGWWGLCPIVPWILAVQEGQQGDNRFGPDPKAAKPKESVEIPPEPVSGTPDSIPMESSDSNDVQHMLNDKQHPAARISAGLLDHSAVEIAHESNQIIDSGSTESNAAEPTPHSSESVTELTTTTGSTIEPPVGLALVHDETLIQNPNPIVMRVAVTGIDRGNAEPTENIVPGSTKFHAEFVSRDGKKSVGDLRQSKADSKNHRRWGVTLSVVGGCSIFLVLSIAIIATLKNQKRNEHTSRSYTPYSNGTATRGRQDEAQQTTIRTAIKPDIPVPNTQSKSRKDFASPAQKQIVDDWLAENHSKMFDSHGQMTQFGKFVDEIAQSVDREHPDLNLYDGHQEVLKRIAAAEQASSSEVNRDTRGRSLSITKTREGNRYYGELQYREAVTAFEQAIAADSKNPTPKNNLARILATCPDSAFRDGNRAVRLAVEASRESNDGDWKTMCVVAAAYAETGDFTSATNWVQKAQRLGEADRATTKGLLTQFRNREPCRW